MTQGRIGKLLLVALFIAIGAAIGYFIYSGLDPGDEETPVSQGPKPPRPEPPAQEEREPPQEKPEQPETAPPEKAPSMALPEEGYCTRVEKDLEEFFRYLNTRDYVKHFEPEPDTYTRFLEIVKQLESDPPVPAGEGIDPRIIIRNVYYFFRILDRDDLRLIREVIRNEADTMEINLLIFYRWLNSKDRCPGLGGARPSGEALYRYAGYLLNTVGGRAYLSRRPPQLRVLISYYCILIVHRADLRGRNNYGIDIFPYVLNLADEIRHYPDLQFYPEYMERLKEIEGYYYERR